MSAPSATSRVESPIGSIFLSADGSFLSRVSIGKTLPGYRDDSHPILATARSQLSDWFDGKREGFDLPLVPLDSPEGIALRAGIASIPYGATLTYGALAAQLGSVARAVGQACKTNPYPLIIPCHRVTSSSGPEFYSGGGGARTKSWLLDFEYDHLPPDQRTRLI